MLLAIRAPDILQHVVAPPAAKIEVDVGQPTARRVEKPFKQQVVRQRIDRGYVKTVGHERVGDAAACAHRYLLLACIGDNIGDDQKKRRKPTADDRLKLAGQPLLDCGIGAVAAAVRPSRLRSASASSAVCPSSSA